MRETTTANLVLLKKVALMFALSSQIVIMSLLQILTFSAKMVSLSKITPSIASEGGGKVVSNETKK